MSATFNKLETAYLASACLEAEAEPHRPPHAVYAAVASRHPDPRDAAVSDRAVSKAVEEGVLPRGDAKTYVFDAAGVYYLVSLGHCRSVVLSRDAKARLFRAWRDFLTDAAGGDAEPPVFELEKMLVFKPGSAARAWTRLVSGYADDRQRYIEVDGEKMGGAPVIRGTRITVRSVLARHDRGDPLAEIAGDHPEVPADAFAAALAYARTHPERGRPRRRLR